jgi:hypothetical protein
MELEDLLSHLREPGINYMSIYLYVLNLPIEIEYSKIPCFLLSTVSYKDSILYLYSLTCGLEQGCVWQWVDSDALRRMGLHVTKY